MRRSRSRSRSRGRTRTPSFQSSPLASCFHGVYHAKDPVTRNRREAWVEGILGEIPVLPYDERVARVLAPLDARLQASGNKIATADLIIAATALTHDHAVLTRDAKSFPKIPGLKHYIPLSPARPVTGRRRCRPRFGVRTGPVEQVR